MTRVIDLFFKGLKVKYPQLNIQVSGFFVHQNTAWLFTLLEELVTHHIKKDDMKIFISEYIAFETAGWKELMQTYFDTQEKMSAPAVQYVRGMPVVR